MRRNFTCPICDTFVETEMDDDGYAICPKCENTTHLENSIMPKLHIEKLEARIAELEGRIAKAKDYLRDEMGDWQPQPWRSRNPTGRRSPKRGSRS